MTNADGYGIIYRASSPSGKVYIGQTIFSLDFRRRQHESTAYNKRSKTYNVKINQAIRKYGKVLVWEVLHANIPRGLLNMYEIDEIAKHDSYRLGYNSTPGGNNVVITAETRKKMRRKSRARSKLSSKDVRKIRDRYKNGTTTQKQLAQEYGVSPSTIGRIIRNIRWKTDRSKDIRHTKMYSNENNPKAKLTIDDVREIRKLYSLGTYTHLELAKKFDVQAPAIYKILNNKTWYDKNYHPYKAEHTGKKINRADANKIRTMYNDGSSLGDLGRKFGISKDTVRLIIRNKIWVEDV